MPIPELTRQIASGIGWLATSLIGITAIFSAAGFLVIRSHQDLLGITGLVPMLPETWPIEGARFIYNSLFYLVGGILSNSWIFLLILVGFLLIVITTGESLPAKTTFIMRNSLAKLLIVVLMIGVLLLLIYIFFKYENISYLLVKPVFVITEQSIIDLRSENVPDDILQSLKIKKENIFKGQEKFLNSLKSIIVNEQLVNFKTLLFKHTIDKSIKYRRNEQGVELLRSKYALLEASIFFIFVCLKSLPYLLNMNITAQGAAKKIVGFIRREKSVKDSTDPVWFSFCYMILWFFFLVLLILLPMDYGKLAKSNDFFKVHLTVKPEGSRQQNQTSSQTPLGVSTGSVEASRMKYEGWLLYKDSKEIVLYNNTSSLEAILILKRDEISQIQIITFDNIFSDM